LFACPGAVPLFRTTAAVAALQLQFSRICLKQIYMEGSVRAEFINAALEKLPRFFVVFFFFDFAIISWQSKALIVVCVGQVPQKGRFARQLVFVAFRLEAYAKFAFCFFAAWNVGIWAGFRAASAAAGPANSATP